MIRYDPSVIQEFAEKLYRKANSIIVVATLLGIFIGAGLGALGIGLRTNSTVNLILVIAGGLIGFTVGRERAFTLKLNAQTSLCQVQIEQNTREGNHETKENA
jgi:hypothetical protein